MISPHVEKAMAMAYDIAEISGCHDKRVGCVLLTKEYKFVSSGCNLSCNKPKCLKEQGKTCPAIHAEIVALEHAGNCKPRIAVCTLEPCIKCAQELYKAGVREIYFHKRTSVAKTGMFWFKDQPDTLAVEIGFNTSKVKSILQADFMTYSHSVIFPWLTGLLTGFSYATCEPEDKSEDKPDWASLFNDIRQYHKDLKYPEEFFRSEQSICVLQKQQIRTMVLALVDEAHEALHEVDWKPWKNYNMQPKVNIEKFLEETGDILFFIDGMLMTFGLSWDDLMQAVAQKLKVVRDRMATGYHN